MKNVSIAFILVFSLFANSILANNPFVNGDSAFVSVIPGLNLRLSPSSNAEVITVLDFGQPVCIVEVYDDKTFRIGWSEGSWTLIDYEGVHGYVFSGFLSPVSLPSPRIESDFFSLCELLEIYSIEEFGPVWQTDTVNFHTGLDKHFHIKKKSKLSDGVVLTQHIYWDREKLIIEVPGIRIMDAYYVLNGLVRPYEKQHSLVDQILFITDESNSVKEFYTSGNKRIHVKKKGKNLIEITVSDSLSEV